MFKPQTPAQIGTIKDYQYEDAKRKERKQDRRRRDARKGKRLMWSESE